MIINRDKEHWEIITKIMIVARAEECDFSFSGPEFCPFSFYKAIYQWYEKWLILITGANHENCIIIFHISKFNALFTKLY